MKKFILNADIKAKDIYRVDSILIRHYKHLSLLHYKNRTFYVCMLLNYSYFLQQNIKAFNGTCAFDILFTISKCFFHDSLTT